MATNKNLYEIHPSVLTHQKADQIHMACKRVLYLFNTPEQNADPDAIYTHPKNVIASLEDKINVLSHGLVKIRLVSHDYLFFRLADCGKTFFIKRKDAFGRISKQLLEAQDYVEQLKSNHENFISRYADFQKISHRELMEMEVSQFRKFCEDFYDKIVVDTNQLYYLPTIEALNNIIMDVFGGSQFYPKMFVDDSSRLVLQIHTDSNNEKFQEVTRKRYSLHKKEKVISYIEKNRNTYCLINENKKMKKIKTKQATTNEQTVVMPSINEINDMNIQAKTKKIAEYLVQVNNHHSELHDFAMFSGVSSESLIANATNGAVKFRFVADAIVLEETATGYASAFLIKFFTDEKLEKRLIQDISAFICRAMMLSNEDVSETTNTAIAIADNTAIDENITIVDNTTVIDNAIVNEKVRNNTSIIDTFNTLFVQSKKKIIESMKDAKTQKQRKQRLFSNLRSILHQAGYKGDERKETVLQFFTQENRKRYDSLVKLTSIA